LIILYIFNKLVIEEMLHSTIKAIYEKLTINIILSHEKLKYFPLIRTIMRISTPTTSSKIDHLLLVLKALDRALGRREKERK
jgi:hypothetical protein